MSRGALHDLQERYHFVEALGRGAEGEVYLVRDPYRGGDWLALKILAGSDLLELSHESLRLSDLHHPVFARVVDAGTALFRGEVRQYLASDYFPGVPITKLRGEGADRLFEAALREACAGLARLHERGLCHGDLKPAHLLVREKPPAVRVLDLGLCRPVGARPRGGTPPYMAPEMSAPGSTRTESSGIAPPTLHRTMDVYAIGMITLEFLAGGLPTLDAGRTWPEWHRDQDRSSLFAALPESGSTPLRSFARACLSPLPGDRPQDAEALFNALRGSERFRPGPERPPWIGREAEGRALHEWAARHARSGNAVLAIVGAHGMGKSRLLESLTTVASLSGLQIWSWNGHETDRPWPVVTAPNVVVLDHVPPGRFPELIDWWTGLARTLRGPRPALVITIAPEELSVSPPEFLRPLARGTAEVTPVALGPLANGEAEALWQSCGGDPVEFARLDSRSATNPGELVHRAHTRDTDREPVPAASPPLADLLRALPHPISTARLARACFRSERQLWRELTSIRPAPAITHADGEWRVQPLTDRFVVQPGDEVPRWIQKQLGRLANELIGDQPERSQTLRALAERDRSTLADRRALLRSRGRWAELASLATAMIRLGIDDDDNRWSLREAWLESGRFAHALEDLPAEGDDGWERLTSHQAVVASRILESAGHAPRARAICERRLREGPGPGEPATIELRLQTAHLALQRADGERARELTSDILDARDGSADWPDLNSADLQRLATLAIQLGRPSRGLALNERALDLARREGPDRAGVVLRALSGIAGYERTRGDLAAAERRLTLALRYARLARRTADALLTLANLAGVQYERGRLDRARDLYRDAERELLRTGYWLLVPHVEQGLATVLRDRGEFLEALVVQRRALRFAHRLGNRRALAEVHSSLGELYLVLGNPVAAYRSRLECLRLSRLLGDPRLERRAAATLAVVLHRLGDRRSAVRWLARAEADPGRGGPRIDAIVAAVRAELRSDHGTAPLALWAHALRLAHRSGRSYYPTRALLGLVLELVHDRRLDRARALLARAEALAEREPNPSITRARVSVVRALIDPADARPLQRDLRSLFRTCHRLHLFEESLLVGALLRVSSLDSDGRAVPPLSRDIDSTITRLASAWHRRWPRDGRRALFDRWPWPAELPWPFSAKPLEATRSEPDAVAAAAEITDLRGRVAALTRELDLERSSRDASSTDAISTARIPASGSEPDRWPPRPLDSALIETALRDSGLLETALTARRDATAVTHDLEEGGASGSAPWVCRSRELRDLAQKVTRFARTDLSGWVCGESGAGKSAWIAHLHRESERRSEPFVVESCAALPAALLEVELFGYARGAFTGADSDRAGLLASCRGGTLVLDQIEELALPLQQTLLRVLEERRFRPIGGTEEQSFDARVIATSRRSPRDLLEAGEISRDLYYRLQGFELEVPALREHREDIAELLKLYLGVFAERFGRRTPHVVESAEQILVHYAWPGNVRELINCCQRWVVLGQEVIGLAEVADFSRMAAAGLAPEFLTADWRQATAHFQRQFLLHHLGDHHWNQSATAKSLGITRRYLQMLLDRLDLRSWIDPGEARSVGRTDSHRPTDDPTKDATG